MTPALPSRVIPSDAARAVGMFRQEGQVGYVSSLGGPIRTTREEATADYISRLDGRQISQPPIRLSPAKADNSRPEAGVPHPPFPAAAMETLARARAWQRFLTETRFSLDVWRLDPVVRAECENVVSWINRCCDELRQLSSQPPPVAERTGARLLNGKRDHRQLSADRHAGSNPAGGTSPPPQTLHATASDQADAIAPVSLTNGDSSSEPSP